MKDIRIYKRGQVWMVHENQDITDAKMASGEHVIAKSRPCLVITDMLSSTIDNGMIQVIPISSKTSYLNEDDIVFINETGDYSRLIVSQITTKDIRQMGFYMFSFTSEMMNRVDDLLNRRLHLNNVDNPRTEELAKENEKLKEKISNLEKVIKEKASSKEAKNERQIVNQSKSDKATVDKVTVENDDIHKIKPDIPSVKTSADECKVGSTPKYKRPTKSTNKKVRKASKSSSGRHRWTREAATEMMSLYDEFGCSETAQLYNVSYGTMCAAYRSCKEKYN